ncbi:MAG: GntR family transcriptional regulator/MocR family aminotransferase [Hyphomicrobiaceae bacterium]|jgi:GntR family transcriptional regulator/MocR family aminotransferase
MDLLFNPAPESQSPVFRQLADHLTALVATGRVSAGAKLPASRELAETLGLGRNTVSRAYEQLVTNGVCVAHVGQGTFVSAPPTGTATARTVPLESDDPTPREFAWSGLFARRAERAVLPPVLLGEQPPVRFDFRGGLVDGASLPARDFAWAFSRALIGAKRVQELAAHRDPYGWMPLRQEVVRHLVSRGIHCEVEDVAIVNGSQHAIHLAACTLVDPGDCVVVETPGYFGATVALRSCEAHLIGVSVDEDGLRTDELARVCQARRPKLIHVTPATQCPTGVRLSDARRQALHEIANRYQVPIFEDDYDAELRYFGAAVPALKTRDEAGQIIYAGTFSKILFPSLRLGYVVAARPLLRKMVAARWQADFGSPVVEQEAVASLLRTGALDRHLKRVRAIYGSRLSTMLRVLEESMPEGVSWSQPVGGQAVWVTVPSHLDGAGLRRAAEARGIAYASDAVFSLDGREGSSFMLSFTSLEETPLAEGISELAGVIRSQLDRSAPTTNPTNPSKSPSGQEGNNDLT